MIARIWRGRTEAAKADSYFEYLSRTGIPQARATPGNRGVTVYRRIDGGVAEFLFVSLWESFDAIRAFAGDEVEKAVYYPEDADFLLEREPFVRHYDVLGESG